MKFSFQLSQTLFSVCLTLLMIWHPVHRHHYDVQFHKTIILCNSRNTYHSYLSLLIYLTNVFWFVQQNAAWWTLLAQNPWLRYMDNLLLIPIDTMDSEEEKRKRRKKKETIYLGPETNTNMFVFLKGAGISGRGLVIRTNTQIAYI